MSASKGQIYILGGLNKKKSLSCCLCFNTKNNGLNEFAKTNSFRQDNAACTMNEKL